MKPLPERATLEEAADAMTLRTGDAWTARDVLSAAARGEVTVHAKLPHGCRMVRCEPTPEGPNEWDCPAEILFPLDPESARRLLSGPSVEVRELWGLVEQCLPGPLGAQYVAVPAWKLAPGEMAPSVSEADCSVEGSILARLVTQYAVGNDAGPTSGQGVERPTMENARGATTLRDSLEFRLSMNERLEPRRPWRGGRITDIDVLTLAEAAREATRHAETEVTVADFLRAAARGEIRLLAIVRATAKVQKHDGGIYCNASEPTENITPKGAIPYLPLTACRQLANAGRASWRTYDGFVFRDGLWWSFTEGRLTDDEPDFETVLDDCRVTGYDVHALADAFAGDDEGSAAVPTEPTTPTREARSVVSGEATQRRRRDNLQRAIFDAWGKDMHANASASEVFDYLVRADDTGYIRGRDGDELMWENTSGGISRTPLAKLAERLTKYRAEYERSR